MCVVSAVYDYGRKDLWPPASPWQPIPNPFPVSPGIAPALPPIVIPDKDEQIRRLEEKLREFEKLAEAAKRYDEATGQPHCQDPVKAQVMERVLEALERIEKKLDPKPEPKPKVATKAAIHAADVEAFRKAARTI